MSETKSLTREQFADGMRHFNERIELAQASGDSRIANAVYMEQQRWIAHVSGNGPIVGAHPTAGTDRAALNRRPP